MKRLLLAVSLLSLLVLTSVQPASAQDSMASLMSFSCRGLSATHSLCSQLQGELRATSRSESMTKRIERTRSWSVRPTVRQRGAALARSLGKSKGRHSAARLADLGMAHLLAGNFGEAMHHLMGALKQSPKLAVAIDGAFVGYMLASSELEPFQQADWADDLAGRIGHDWPTDLSTPVTAAQRPRAVDVTRVAYLYWLADKSSAAFHFTKLGLHWYPNNKDLQTFAEFLLENQPKATKKKKTKSRSKGRYSR